ncbi:unnamed protein product [Oppiella nova]|uniref:SLC26A/SulP transporter domain-containing protein n=1 Tax=Oppiella nova TaxID=334625 RepID=A0A7R9LFU8_9ACAR|nr:unnamed protein product [Oppiella nova]CAG2163252.1 unnamed protein product [Oppiella nova]
MDSLVIAIVAFAVSLSLAKIFAKKHKYKIDANQELIALGTANVFSSFFACYPSSASLSRSSVQEKTGGRTQVAGLVSSAFMLVFLLFLGPLLYHLPKANMTYIVNLKSTNIMENITPTMRPMSTPSNYFTDN